jgi:hypothetical protein
MSDSITEFKKGNKWFVDALNAVIKYARGHGVNPAGVPGWSWTVDGWQPPRASGGEGVTLDPWDIISAPNTEGLSKLRAPFCIWSHDEITKTVSITNAPMELEPDTWIVAKAVGPIADFVETPALEIDIVDEWEWYPNAHKFTDGDPYEWLESYLPLWKLVAEDDRTADMVKVGVSGDVVIYGRRYVYGAPRLAIHLANTIDPSRIRSVPELF